MTYISKSSFSLFKSKSLISSSSKTLSWYISFTTSIYLSSLSIQLCNLLCKKLIIFSNLFFQSSIVSDKSNILFLSDIISLFFSLLLFSNVLTLKESASLFSVRVFIFLFLSFIWTSTFVKVLDKVCILSYSLFVLSTLLIKSINDSLSSFDNM